jgi:hypothetical protein
MNCDAFSHLDSEPSNVRHPNRSRTGLIHGADAAMDNYDRALTTRNPAEIAKARARHEGLREELEKLHKSMTALASMRSALNQPMDFATGTMIKTKSALQQRAIDYRRAQFDKLQRTGALSK